MLPVSPEGIADGSALDELNRRIGEEAIVDGRVFFGDDGVRREGRVPAGGGELAHRPEDVELIVDVVRELGARCRGEASRDRRILGMTTAYGGVLASSRAVYAWEKRAEISGVS